MDIRYHIPFRQYVKLIFAAITGHSLSFRQLAIDCVSQLKPGFDVSGIKNLPVHDGYVILVNHYYRPGFRAWWIPLAISSVVPREMHWIMAAAWTFSGKPYEKILEKFSRYLFKKIAVVYHFTNMPPMPPRPSEVLERAQAVRKVVRLVHKYPSIVLGLAPEGGDNLDGKMHLPPPGAGRFIAHLQSSGLALVPAGIYETDRLCLRIGAPFHLDPTNDRIPGELDEKLARQVYNAIAALLPENLI